MARTRKTETPEYAKLDKELYNENLSRLIANSEYLESTQIKIDRHRSEQGTNKNATLKSAKKSFSARLFGCLPCNGNGSEVDDDMKPSLKNRK